MRTSQEVKTIEESFVRRTGAGECFSAGSRHGDVALRATATLWSRVAHARRDQAPRLEALERGVQRTRGDGASRTIRQFRANGHAVKQHRTPRVVPSAAGRRASHSTRRPILRARAEGDADADLARALQPLVVNHAEYANNAGQRGGKEGQRAQKRGEEPALPQRLFEQF
jgi:hypothetical protein